MEWIELYPKNRAPAYADLLAYFPENIRALFLRFDAEMRARFDVKNRYHRFLPAAGWAYGYGRSYNCELLTVIISENAFHALGVAVTDEISLGDALSRAQAAYDAGFEQRYAEISARRRADQSARSKLRVAREQAEIEKLIESVDIRKHNKFRWPDKVARSDLLRLYTGEARGMLDEDLLDDIGFAFYARCKRGMEARALMEKGRIICHHCGAILVGGRVSRTGAALMKSADNYKPINCACGYSYTYREYRRSCNSENMPGGRATPIFERFIEKWPECRDSRAKMLLIDWLIHECHVTLMSGDKGRSVGVNLIEGTVKQVTELITRLAYGE